MDIDYDKAIALQGSWGHTPTTPLVDQQAKDTGQTQLAIYRMVKETIQNNLSCGGNQE